MTTLITAAKKTTNATDRGSLQMLIIEIIIPSHEPPLQASSSPIPRVIKWSIVIT